VCSPIDTHAYKYLSPFLSLPFGAAVCILLCSPGRGSAGERQGSSLAPGPQAEEGEAVNTLLSAVHGVWT